jgi:hypothetical protein
MTDALELAGAFVLGFLICAGLAVVLFKHLIDLHREERQIGLAESESWRGERRELLNRIQHPERMPVGTAPQVRVPDPAVRERMREMASVGRVVPTAENGDGMELP